MTFLEKHRSLERMAHLIKRKSTGRRPELARKLNVCVRTVDNLLVLLRDMCAVDIYYCPVRNSYCFDGDVDVRFDFVIVIDSTDDIKGGQKNISFFDWSASFLRRWG
jgi:hypothetical protein